MRFTFSSLVCDSIWASLRQLQPLIKLIPIMSVHNDIALGLAVCVCMCEQVRERVEVCAYVVCWITIQKTVTIYCRLTAACIWLDLKWRTHAHTTHTHTFTGTASYIHTPVIFTSISVRSNLAFDCISFSGLLHECLMPQSQHIRQLTS